MTYCILARLSVRRAVCVGQIWPDHDSGVPLFKYRKKLECGPMPNVTAAIGI